MDHLNPARPFTTCSRMDRIKDKSDFEYEPLKSDDERMRRCLVCGTDFLSSWAGNRVCKRCRATSTWKSGGG